MTDPLPRHAGSTLFMPREASSHPGLQRALACLHEFWNRPVSLALLASEAGMSPAYFCRQFTRIHGLPPHRYQTVLRVTRAKEMLAKGDPIADVAAMTGFADQSHLGRHLKSCLGLTPGDVAPRRARARTF